MAFTVAISGKGGTGKSTIAALVIRALTERFGKTVLAVDGDPNASLGMMFGIDVTETVSDLREDVVERRIKTDPGASRERQIEMMIHETVVECKGFDLLTMGRPEGPKCYCYVNHMLRKFLDGLSESAPYVVIDNEAGMEHLSRLTTNDVELLLEVAAPTVADIVAARRIDDLVGRLPIKVRQKGLVISRATDHIPERVKALIVEGGLEVLGSLPLSGQIAELSQEGRPITELPFDDPALKAVLEIVEKNVLRK